MSGDDFFIGWADVSRPTRRFLFGAAIGLAAGGAALGATFALAQGAPGDGAWDQGAIKDYKGLLMRAPYPALRTFDLDGTPRTAFLATGGKLGVTLPDSANGMVRVRASLIARGRHAMLAVTNRDWISPLSIPVNSELADWPERDLGEVMLGGEILDAKCWFGAMRPGFGKTHKACAALCARGGLPIAFCEGPDCSRVQFAPLLLDAQGRAHSRSILPYIGDQLIITRARRVQVGDVVQLRADIVSLRRV